MARPWTGWNRSATSNTKQDNGQQDAGHYACRTLLPPRTGAGDHPCQLPDDRARHLDRHHRAPEDSRRSQLLGHRAFLGAERLYARLRRLAPARRAPAISLAGAACSSPDWRSSLPHRSPSVWRSQPSGCLAPAFSRVSAPRSWLRRRLPFYRRTFPQDPSAHGRSLITAPSPVSARASASCSAASSRIGFPGASGSSSTCLSGLP
jgi:hypothetical protein